MGQNFVLRVFRQCAELRLKFVAYLNVPLFRLLILAWNTYAVKYIFAQLVEACREPGIMSAQLRVR